MQLHIDSTSAICMGQEQEVQDSWDTQWRFLTCEQLPVVVQEACVRRMYDGLAGASTVMERDVVSLLLATLDPKALLDAGQLAEFEAVLRYADPCTRSETNLNGLPRPV